MPKVSIICPIHNTAMFLPTTIENFCNQTFEDIEILLINDDSTDDSQSIIDYYARLDKRIKTFYRQHEKNEYFGYTPAVNIGRCNASGEYVIFPDSDDIFNIDAVEKLYEVAKDTKVDVVKGSMNVIELTGEITQLPRIVTSGPIIDWTILEDDFKFTHFCPKCPELQTMLLRNEFQKHIYFFPNSSYMDGTTQFKIKALAKSFYYIKDHVYTAVAREGSISRNKEYHQDRMVAGLDELELFLKQNKVRSEIWPYFGFYQFFQMGLILSKIDDEKAFINYLKEMKRRLQSNYLNIDWLKPEILKTYYGILNSQF